MTYLLDTCICVHILRGKFQIKEKVEQVGIKNCAISEITKIELLYGASCSKFPEQNKKLVLNLCSLFNIIPISEAVECYVDQKTRLRKDGSTIEDFDLLIGATALSKKMIMVSENIRHMERIQGLNIDNWVCR